MELAAQKVQAFNARPEAERRAAVERYLDARQQQVGIDWSWFGLSTGEAAFVSVDELAALLSIKFR